MIKSKLICAIAVLGVLVSVYAAGNGGTAEFLMTEVWASEAAVASDGESGESPDQLETQGSDLIAGEGETVTAVDVVDEDAVPVTAEDLQNGVYGISVESSSSMFTIDSAELHVEDGKMYAVMTMGGKGYLYLYPGTPEEAVAAPESDYIPFEENGDGAHTFTIPLESLNTGVDCAAFSKRKQKWYARTLMFAASSLPPEAFKEDFFTTPQSLELKDGTYTCGVVLSGGSGRASVESPCSFTVSGGKASARIIFSSPNYDYMIVDGEKYLPVNSEGNSAFEIPLSYFDYPMAIKADTTAMSEPHEIDYTLTFDSTVIEEGEAASDAASFLTSYAREFTMEQQDDGSVLVTIGEDSYTVDHPYSKIYLASSSAMDLFRSAGAIENVAMTGTRASDWGIPEIRQLVEDETIVYAGKYSMPDYEYLLSEDCDLAIENTMIYHTPEVKEKLESLGIPVLVERSSYEKDPCGRMEWIKLYGLLTGHYEEACSFFEEKVKELESLNEDDLSGKRVVFFHINSNGQPVVRRPDDYVARMIEMAGGEYFLKESDGQENMLSTMNMQMEAFADAALDADILIYNSSIDGEVKDMEELLSKEELLGEFRAVREGNVWCTGKNMFQETSHLADIILEMNRIFSENAGEGESLRYFRRLSRQAAPKGPGLGSAASLTLS